MNDIPECVWGQGECVPDCPNCKRMDELIAERAAGYKEGYSAAMDDGWGDPGHVKAETERIVGIIKAYYAVAPKAAEPLLDRISED